MGRIRRLIQLEPALATLLLADLAINTGFFMLVPFIAIHVHDNLGLTATAAGIVLAVRTGTQQASMVFIGPVADLFGYKRVLLLGLLVRAVGFASFALMSNLPGLIVSAVVSSLGGALFSSAERAAFATLATGEGQTSKFSLLYTAQSIGTTVGPLVGALLLSYDFRLLSVIAGLVYLPIALLIHRTLPDLGTGRQRPPASQVVQEVFRSILAVSRNRLFVTYSLITTGFWVISTQINLSIALHAANITGNQTAVKYLLMINALMVVALQYKISQWATARWPILTLWATGTLIASLAFLVLVPFPTMAGMVVSVVMLALGGMLVKPSDYTMLTRMAPRDSLASYHGFSAISVGIGGSTGQILGGRLTDLAATTGSPLLPWIVFAVIGMTAALAMFMFRQRLDHLEMSPRRN